MRLRIDLDAPMQSALIQQASAERRPVPMQAEVALRRALGLPIPIPANEEAPAGRTEGAR